MAQPDADAGAATPAEEATLRALLAAAAVDSPVDLKQVLSRDFDDDEPFSAELLSPLSSLDDTGTDDEPVGGSRRTEWLIKLQTENAALRREASASRAELQRFKEAMLASRMATRREVDDLRTALQAFQAEVPALRERLGATKARRLPPARTRPRMRLPSAPRPPCHSETRAELCGSCCETHARSARRARDQGRRCSLARGSGAAEPRALRLPQAHFRDLRVSEARYREIKATADENVSAVEFVQAS